MAVIASGFKGLSSYYLRRGPLQEGDKLLDQAAKRLQGILASRAPSAPETTLLLGQIQVQIRVVAGDIVRRLGGAHGGGGNTGKWRGHKGTFYEGGIREPMIVKWPGVVDEASICSEPVISTDFYPTILAMAGLDAMPEQHVDGVDLTPVITGQGSIPERPLYWHYPHYSNQGGKPGAAVRLGNFKLIEFFEDHRVELYDLSADPGEYTNLAEQLPQQRDELLRMLHRWQVSTGAEGMDPNPGYDPGYEKTDL